MNQHVAAAESALRRLARQRATATRLLADNLRAADEERDTDVAEDITVQVWDEAPTPFEQMIRAQRAYTWLSDVPVAS